jgi:ParB-like chromosome segregation protein Spo0J
MNKGTVDEQNARYESLVGKILERKYIQEGKKVKVLTEQDEEKEIFIFSIIENDEETEHFETKKDYELAWELYNTLIRKVEDTEEEIEKKLEPDSVVLIDVDKIDTSDYQFRTDFSDVSDLAESLKMVGQTTPIRLEKIEEDKYRLISGERRLRAAKMLGWPQIKAFVNEADPSSSLLIGGIENFQRRNLKPSNSAKQIISFREEIKKYNRLGNLYPVIPEEEYKLLSEDWKNDVWLSNRYIDEAIEKALGLKRNTQNSLIRLLRDGNEDLAEAIDKGRLSIEEGGVVVRLELQNFPEEVQKAIATAKTRSDYIKRMTKRVEGMTDDSFRLLKGTSKLSSALSDINKIKIKYADEKTLQDSKKKMIDFIITTMEKFEITIKEIEERRILK